MRTSGLRPSHLALPAAGFLLLVAVLLFREGVGASGGGEGEGPRDYATLEWMDLLPGSDFEALMNPPAWLDSIEEGSEADQIDPALFEGDPASLRYLEALTSTNVVSSHDRRAVRLPGFVVPLEFDAAQRVTEFFLVPWFGACLHLPPPPPNQMIHVRYPEGLALRRLEDAYWIEGTLMTAIVDRDVGTSAYALEADQVRAYFDDAD